MNKPEIQRISDRSKLAPKMNKSELAKLIAKKRERDSEMVTGIFKNLQNPASATSRGSVSFGYKAYEGDDYVFYELLDGERYTIPRGVARHLNNNCYFKEYKHVDGQYGQDGMRTAQGDGRLSNKNMQVARKVHRFAFHTLEFMDDDPELNPVDLLEVTVTP